LDFSSTAADCEKGQEKRIANRKTKCEFARARIANFRRGRGLWGVCVVEWIKSVFIIALIKSQPSLLYHISLSLLLNTNKNGRAKWPRRKSRKPQQIE